MLLFLLASYLLALCKAGVPMCKPPCIPQCSVPPDSVADCDPVCLPPVCSTFGCSLNAPARCFFPSCRTSCPADQCQVSCPVCETLCDALPSICVNEGCQIVCEEPQCSWTCAKPSLPPISICEWECPMVPCATPSSATDWLEVVWTLVVVLAAVLLAF